MSQLLKLKFPILPLAAAGLLVAVAPTPADAQRGPRRAVVAQRPVHRPVYRPVVRYYSYPYYWRSIWWASYGSPWGFYGYPSYGYPYRYFPADITSSLRLQVTPRDAEVFVDGYAAGVVDDFDGVFQRLRLQPGGHEIAVYLNGYRTFRQNIHLSPGANQTIRHELEQLAPGESMEAPPAPDEDRAEPQQPPSGRYDPRPSQEAAPDRDRPDRPGPRERFGTLSIRVQPADAEILVDGEPWTAPAGSSRIAIELAEGRHAVEVRKSGFSVYREEVLIRPNATTNLNVGLVNP